MFKFFKKQKINQDILEQIEEELILADIGINTVNEIIAAIKKNKFDKDVTLQELKEFIRNIIINLFNDLFKNNKYTLNIDSKPFVILVFGTNGSGKTTTIAKLANHFKKLGYNKIMLAAGDTFRSGATEQLITWGNRLGLSVFSKNDLNNTNDPAALIFQAATKAKNENFDILIADTSGRFSNDTNLMQELQKIEKVLQKVDSQYPNSSILVLDGTLGQSSLHIAKGFLKAVNINNLVITKLDGSSKGGAVLPISKELKLPVLFLGLGETADDLTAFTPEVFASKVLDL
ncbi:signal recognition particle-docking protein FtsY [Rickettsiales bacterium LUAb2]